MKRITAFLISAFTAIAAWLAVHFGLVEQLVPVDPRLKAINTAVRRRAPSRRPPPPPLPLRCGGATVCTHAALTPRAPPPPRSRATPRPRAARSCPRGAS